MQIKFTETCNNLTKSHDDYLGSMRSSRINPKTSLDYDYNATQTKSLNQNSKFFDFNDGMLDTACTTKRLIATPVKKLLMAENDSKKTLLNYNQQCQYNKFNNPFAVTNCCKFEDDENNKENSNIKSNLFSSQSPVTDESDYNSSSNFKMPMKKLEFSNNLKQGKYDSVRLNLQKTFNSDSSLSFSKTKNEPQLFNHSLISSSEKSSSHDSTFISKKESNNSKEKEIMKEHMNEIKMCLNNHPSETSQTESLVEGLSRKAFFNVPKEKINDEKYKILALKKIRKSTYKDNKSTSKVDVSMSDFNGKGNYPESMIQLNLFNKRRKLIHSVKKIYASEISLLDQESKVTKNFRMFKDSDIGINEDWQKFLKDSKGDEDVLTDEETITNATAFAHRNLMESITFLYNNRDSGMIHNVCYISK